MIGAQVKALVAQAIAALALVSTSAFADEAKDVPQPVRDPLNMPEGVTTISGKIYNLHMDMLWICVVIGVLVFGAMFYSIIMHRKSRGVTPATFHHSTAVEIIWTFIPFVILIVMALPAAKLVMEMEDNSGSELTVKITGYQWKWHYEYPAEGIDFYAKLDDASNAARKLGSGIDVATVPYYLQNVQEGKELVLPTNTKVLLYITSEDVIHAWWVPQLALKQDAIPGITNSMWVNIKKPGVYRGVCAELCGRDHGYMPIVVKAVPMEEYKEWVKSRQPKAVATQTTTLNAPVVKEGSL